jgi:hypothetical protein
MVTNDGTAMMAGNGRTTTHDHDLVYCTQLLALNPMAHAALSLSPFSTPHIYP